MMCIKGIELLIIRITWQLLIYQNISPGPCCKGHRVNTPGQIWQEHAIIAKQPKLTGVRLRIGIVGSRAVHC